MSINSEEFTLVEEAMEAVNNTEPPAGRKDEIYYWADNVTFSVEDTLFRVSRYPFLLGSDYFVEKYGLLPGKDESSSRNAIHLEGVTAAHFRVFLKFMFPIHLTSTTATYDKEEWIIILTLSTTWHFHEARKLAIQHLDGQLTDLEFIRIGREAHVPRWVAQGYTAIIERPVQETISESEGEAIGHREVNRLWAIRYRRAACGFPPELVQPELQTAFSEEFARIRTHESQHRTKAEVEEMEKEEEAREAALREIEELESEKLRIEEEEERVRTEDEDAQREWFEDEERRLREEEETLSVMTAEEPRLEGRVVAWKRQSAPLLQERRRIFTQGVWGTGVVVRAGSSTGAATEGQESFTNVETVAGTPRIVGFIQQGGLSVSTAKVEHVRKSRYVGRRMR